MSPVRRRILETLLRHREVNITALARMVSATHKAVDYEVRKLVEYGVVEDRKYGRVRIVRLREDSEIVRVLRELLEKARELGEH